MRIFPVYYLFILLHSLFIPSITHSQVQKIYLHPKAPGIGKQSQFVDSIRFIPLETQEGIQIGAYNNVNVTEKYFIIIDYPGKTILLYAKDGSFIKKISYKKLGEGFYPDYDERNNRLIFFGDNKSYSLTSKDRLSITLDWSNPRNKKYFKKYAIDLNDTSFAIVKDLPNQNDIVHANYYYDDFYWQGQINTSPLYGDSLGHEFKIYKNDQVVKSFFPYNRINEPRFLFNEEMVNVAATDTPYTRYVTRPYCDTIYKMIRDSLFPVYQLVLPLENSLPPSFFSRPFKNRTEWENFKRNNGWMLRQVYNFYETPQLIYILVGYLNNFEAYIIQKKTSVGTRVRNIKPDSSQYNLPLLMDYGMLRKGNRFYKTVVAADLISFFEQNKNVPVPRELDSFLKNKPRGNTPVLIEFKLRN